MLSSTESTDAVRFVVGRNTFGVSFTSLRRKPSLEIPKPLSSESKLVCDDRKANALLLWFFFSEKRHVIEICFSLEPFTNVEKLAGFSNRPNETVSKAVLIFFPLKITKQFSYTNRSHNFRVEKSATHSLKSVYRKYTRARRRHQVVVIDDTTQHRYFVNRYWYSNSVYKTGRQRLLRAYFIYRHAPVTTTDFMCTKNILFFFCKFIYNV